MPARLRLQQSGKAGSGGGRRGENRGKDLAEIGRHGEVAMLIELRRRQARPLAIDAAAPDRAAQNPDHVAVAVVGAVRVVLAQGAAELGDDDDGGVLPLGAEAAGEGGKALAERAQVIRELALVSALIDMRIPAAERREGEADAPVAAQE